MLKRYENLSKYCEIILFTKKPEYGFEQKISERPVGF